MTQQRKNAHENPDYLKQQLITYIGNKRTLLPLIEKGITFIQKKINRKKLDCADIFSGSGIVTRFLKQYSMSLSVNDMEIYAEVINKCYLANKSELDIQYLKEIYTDLIQRTENLVAEIEQKASIQKTPGTLFPPGFISELYAPQAMNKIEPGERCFYTPRNAWYLDIMRQNIEKTVPAELQHFFIAPLLAEASIHANTAGIFKGFYKNPETGLGHFGGKAENALPRITGKISLPFPLFSNFDCITGIFRAEANEVVLSDEFYANCRDSDKLFDLVYIDPPYNQHPYGSNYFMLNLLATYERPDQKRISPISGIPDNWNRSEFNKARFSEEALIRLVHNIRSKFLLLSFNSEGFISKKRMLEILTEIGTVTVMDTKYTTFRGSRNLEKRNIHVKEYLYVVEKCR